MVNANETLKKETVQNAYRGDGFAHITQVLEKEGLSGNLLALETYTWEENCGLGKHFYVGESALIYCISGAGWMDDNGEVKKIEAGDSAIFKSGEFFSVRNAEYHDFTRTNKEPMVLLVGIVADENTHAGDAPALTRGQYKTE